ncbi:hypothetical protein INR49_004618 [Caranx melampygus]|nr:hypothetical protein INR49_004618 [Caranx melampygus]
MSHPGAELRILFSPGCVQLVEEEVVVPGLKVLVTGATGLLGRAVCREFQNNGWIVTGTGYRRARPRLLRCDLTDEDAVRGLMYEYKPDVVVHCAAERRALVLRVPVLFGEVESVTESAVTSLWLKVQEATESCTLDHCQQRFPTDARDVAAVCRKLSERARQDPSVRGIFHFSAKEQMTKYEMAVAIAQAFKLPSDHLIPVNIHSDRAAGGVSSSSDQQSAELFSPGAAEPECPTANFHLCHHRLSVALHPRQTLETDCLSLRTDTQVDRQVHRCRVWVSNLYP